MNFLQFEIMVLKSIGYSFELNESVVYPVFSYVGWFLLAAITIPEAHFVIYYASNIPLATDALCALLACFLSLTKLLNLMLRKNRFYKFIGTVKDLHKEG